MQSARYKGGGAQGCPPVGPQHVIFNMCLGNMTKVYGYAPPREFEDPSSSKTWNCHSCDRTGDLLCGN